MHLDKDQLVVINEMFYSTTTDKNFRITEEYREPEIKNAIQEKPLQIPEHDKEWKHRRAYELGLLDDVDMNKLK